MPCIHLCSGLIMIGSGGSWLIWLASVLPFFFFLVLPVFFFLFPLYFVLSAWLAIQFQVLAFLLPIITRYSPFYIFTFRLGTHLHSNISYRFPIPYWPQALPIHISLSSSTQTYFSVHYSYFTVTSHIFLVFFIFCGTHILPPITTFSIVQSHKSVNVILFLRFI